MKKAEDSVTKSYEQNFIDYHLDPINHKFRWTVFGIVLAAMAVFFIKGWVSVEIAAVLILAVWIVRWFRIRDAKFDIAMEELRWRIRNTNSKVDDAHTSLVYINAESLGFANSNRDEFPWVFMWKVRDAASGNELAILELAEMFMRGTNGAVQDNERALKELRWLLEHSSGWYRNRATELLAEMYGGIKIEKD